MRRYRSVPFLAAVAALVTFGPATALHGQQSILFRYHPSGNTAVRTAATTSFEAAIALGGLVAMLAAVGEGMAEAMGNDTAGPLLRDSLEAAMREELGSDSMQITAELHSFVTDQVLEDRGGQYLIHRSLDSLRGQMRATGEAWEPIGGIGQLPATAQFLIDGRMRQSEFRETSPGPSAASAMGVLRAPAGGFAMELPADPVTVGQTWITEMQLPFEPMQAQEGPLTTNTGDLVARTWVTLDSLVDRGGDTLAYVRLRGRFERFATADAGDVVQGSGRVTGTFGGVIVWSTGWSAFVTGSWRGSFTTEINLGPREGAGARQAPTTVGMRFDLRHQFQVKL